MARKLNPVHKVKFYVPGSDNFDARSFYVQNILSLIVATFVETDSPDMPDTTMIIHENAETLSMEDQSLLNRAGENQKLAYAPYSGFLVGAALITTEKQIADGANQENASYPLCMCGERVALYNCAVQYPNAEITTVAIVVRGKKPMKSPAPPCGACLQVLREFETRQNEKPIRLLLKSEAETVWEVPSVKTMLPHAFDGSYL